MSETPRTVALEAPDTTPGKEPHSKIVGGSRSDAFNNAVANQAINTMWHGHQKLSEDEIQKAWSVTMHTMIGLKPQDEAEGMLVAQMIGCHNAAMECFKRAMIPGQTFEGRDQNLRHANRLTRAYTELLGALNKHRGKGQQKVTVEHVHVHEGGQAIVGNIETGVNPGDKLVNGIGRMI